MDRGFYFAGETGTSMRMLIVLLRTLIIGVAAGVWATKLTLMELLYELVISEGK